jgi:hypothetical protein
MARRSASMRPEDGPRSVAVRDSGSRKYAADEVAPQSAEAKYIGADGPKWLRMPPIAGPKMKPRPKAAPTRPMPRARFSGVVTSAM